MEKKKEEFTDVFRVAVGHEGGFKIALNPDFSNHIKIDGLLTEKDKATIKRITDKVVKRALIAENKTR